MSAEPKKQRLACPSYALVYATILPGLQEIARAHGYALAVHGSMATDLDLIACPWTDEATDAETMIEAIRERVVAFFPVGYQLSGEMVPNPQPKPHGRLSWAFHFDFTHPMHTSTGVYAPYLDISVMPRKEPVLCPGN